MHRNHFPPHAPFSKQMPRTHTRGCRASFSTTGVPLGKWTPLSTVWYFAGLLLDFVHVSIIHARRLQLLLVNCASAVPWPLRGGLCTRSVAVICGVVSAVSMPDLSEQFTPPETAPPALVSLIQAIEKRGTSLSPTGAFPGCLSGLRLSLSGVSFPPSASRSHASV